MGTVQDISSLSFPKIFFFNGPMTADTNHTTLVSKPEFNRKEVNVFKHDLIRLDDGTLKGEPIFLRNPSAIMSSGVDGGLSELIVQGSKCKRLFF